MYQLSVDTALAYVRKAIDELISAEEIGMLFVPDALNLHKLVDGSLEEATLVTYNAAPSLKLSGIKGVEFEDFEADYGADMVITIRMLKPTAKILYFKHYESEYIISELIPEESAEGRKQLNPYTRGTYDDPRLVLQRQWDGELMPTLKYYSMKDGSFLSVDLEYLPYPILEDGAILVPEQIRYAILNNLVALVLDTYREFDAAEKYRAKAKELLA
jgi:hypothetical protein